MGAISEGPAASPAPLGPRLRCDCAVTSAVHGGVSEHRGIPTGLKTQPLRPNWTELNWQPSGSIPVSATKYFKINHLQNRRTWPMYKRYNGLRGNSHVNPLSPPLGKMPR